LRGSALYLLERTFDPLKMQMNAELVGRRFCDVERFVIPHEPLITGALVFESKGLVTQLHRNQTGDTEAVSFVAFTSKPRRETQLKAEDVRFGDARSRRIFPLGIVQSQLDHRASVLERRSSSPTQFLWLE
jgi:hypothetical protein